MNAATPSCFDPELLSRLGGLSLRVDAVLDGLYAGGRRGGRLGLALEFSEHRLYAPGDDPRYFDWKAYARTRRLYVRSYESECNVSLAVLVDASGGMNYRGRRAPWSKWKCAQTVAATLAALGLAAGDAAGVTLASGAGTRRAPASAQSGQLKRLADAVEGATACGAIDFPRVCGDFVARAPRRGLVVVLSDLCFDVDALATGLRRLAGAGHQIALLHIVDPDELDFPFDDACRFADLESDDVLDVDASRLREAYLAAVERWRRRARAACVDVGARYALVPTDGRLDAALIPFLAGPAP